MCAEVKVHLFGSLRHLVQSGAESVCLECPEPMLLEELIGKLGISSSAVQLAMLNHRASCLYETVRPGDRLALFPKEYAVFVDWKDFRT